MTQAIAQDAGRRAVRRHGRAPLVLYAALGTVSVGALVSTVVLGSYGPRGPGGPYAYNWLVLLLFVPYGFAVRSWVRSGAPRTRSTVLGFVALAAPLVLSRPFQSHDIYLYVLYAKMQIHGVNPFVTPPGRLGADPWGAGVAWRDQVSAYGPVWILIVTGIVRVTGVRFVASLIGVRAVAVALEAAGLNGLRWIPEDTPHHDVRLAAAAVAFNPLVLSAVALGGHADIAVASAFVWAIVADRRRHPTAAALLLAAAGLVKAYAMLPLVVYLIWRARRRGIRSALVPAAASGALVLAASAPFWAGPATLRGLVEAGTQTSVSLAGTLQDWLARLIGLLPTTVDPETIAATIVRVAGALLVAVVLVRIWRSAPRMPDPWKAALTASIVSFLAAPWFLPWYALGPLALLAGVNEGALAAALLCFTGTGLITLPAPAFQTLARYVPPLVISKRRRLEA